MPSAQRTRMRRLIFLKIPACSRRRIAAITVSLQHPARVASRRRLTDVNRAPNVRHRNTITSNIPTSRRLSCFVCNNCRARVIRAPTDFGVILRSSCRPHDSHPQIRGCETPRDSGRSDSPAKVRQFLCVSLPPGPSFGAAFGVLWHRMRLRAAVLRYATVAKIKTVRQALVFMSTRLTTSAAALAQSAVRHGP